METFIIIVFAIVLALILFDGCVENPPPAKRKRKGNEPDDPFNVMLKDLAKDIYNKKNGNLSREDWERIRALKMLHDFPDMED